PLDVRALDKTRPYGSANPTLTGTITGLQNWDNITATYTTVATPASSAGIYAITPVLHDPDGSLSNYELSTHNGTLTVNRLILNVSVDDKIRPYRAANPVFTGTITGLQNGDNITVTYVTTAISSSPVGAYTITPQLNDANGK